MIDRRFLLSRRALLGTLGVAAVSPLFLRGRAEAAGPKRFVVIHVPEGMWSGAPRPMPGATTLGPILSPLDKHMSRVAVLDTLPPLVALIALYGATLFLTELLSNATVAVLVTPVAVALAESLGVSPRPFLVAVMIAGSAAFATPFGYQTNVLVYQMGGYSYTDFLKVGLPLNLVTWIAAAIAIPMYFPF